MKTRVWWSTLEQRKIALFWSFWTIFIFSKIASKQLNSVTMFLILLWFALVYNSSLARPYFVIVRTNFWSVTSNLLFTFVAWNCFLNAKKYFFIISNMVTWLLNDSWGAGKNLTKLALILLNLKIFLIESSFKMISRNCWIK